MTGSDFEREIKTGLQSTGWFVIRSAGSKAVDLVAIDPENGHTLLLECKTFKEDTFRISKTKELREQHAEMCRLQSMFNGHASVFYVLKKKRQNEIRFIHPSRLSKPYHWDREGNDKSVRRGMGCTN